MTTTARRRKSRLSSFAVCIQTGEDEVDLIVGKIYRVVGPERNDRPSDIRVVDESGEDYLYPRGWFVPVDVPNKVKRALAPAR